MEVYPPRPLRQLGISSVACQESFCINQEGFTPGTHFLPRIVLTPVIKVYRYLCGLLLLQVVPESCRDFN